MRDKRFVAEHRGGLLNKDNHQQLILWAADCAEHVLHLYTGEAKAILTDILSIARSWAKHEAATGQAMKASVMAHAIARTAPDEVSTSVARAVGQAVATAHMADHSLGGALYALQAVNRAGKPVETERAWQHRQLEKLPSHLIQTVAEVMAMKEKSFKL